MGDDAIETFPQRMIRELTTMRDMINREIATWENEDRFLKQVAKAIEERNE